MNETRRGFLTCVLACVGLGYAAKDAIATNSWNLDDLQYGADYLYQHHGMRVNHVYCSHADRRILISLGCGTGYSQDINYIASYLLHSGKFIMLDLHRNCPIFEYDAASRTFRRTPLSMASTKLGEPQRLIRP